MIVGRVMMASFCRDSEARRNREADGTHLGEIGTFPSKKGLHSFVALGLSTAESIDVLGGLSRSGR
jgi:hypothetical protein